MPMLWNRKRYQFGPLELRLLLIVLAALLPLILLAFITLHSNAQNQKKNLIETAQNAMQAVVTSMDAEFEITLSALDALAASPRLQADDFAAFHAEAKNLKERRPDWANVVLSTPRAEQIVNVRVPYGNPLPPGVDPPGVASTADRKTPEVGSLVVSPVFHTHVFAVRMPIVRDDKTKYVLIAVLEASTLQGLIRLDWLPQNAVAVILDPKRRIAARSLNPEAWIGKPATADMMRVMQQGSAKGWMITNTLEGRAIYGFYHRSERTGWSAGIGIPVEVIDGPVQRSYAMLAGSVFFAVLLGLLVAYLVGNSIIRPIKQLEAAAAAVGQGSRPLIPDTPLPEIRRVGAALQTAFVEREALLDKERVARAEESQAREAAESANKAKDEFLAMLGHELRNPLAAIAAAAQLLKLPSSEPERLDRLSAIIQRQSDHLTRLVDDLLDVSRVTRRRIVLQRQTMDLNTVLPEALEQVQALIEERGHRLSLEPAAVPAWVHADRTRLVQIVGNLLHNAAKYTPAGGALRLEVGLTADRVALTVSDNGNGIAADMLPHVFELFQQGARTPDRAQGGLGLGLSLVKGLIELHGGSITASSAGLGCGSTFRFELPRVAPARAAGSAERARLPLPRGALRVVVVDDNADAGETLASYLREGCGFAVALYTDPVAALADAERQAAAVYILDIGMPVMDGHELARRLRAHEQTTGALLIALSGYGLEQDRQASMAAGFDHHMSKPANMEALVALLQQAARSGREPALPPA